LLFTDEPSWCARAVDPALVRDSSLLTTSTQTADSRFPI
jgi:hypothetical protein